MELLWSRERDLHRLLRALPMPAHRALSVSTVLPVSTAMARCSGVIVAVVSRTQHHHARDGVARVVVEGPLHAELAVGAVVEMDIARCALLETDATRRNDDGEILLAQLGRGVRAVGPHGDDRAALVVERDGRVGDVGEGHFLALSADGLVRVEVVENVVGHVDGRRGAVLLCHGSDHNAWTPEELLRRRSEEHRLHGGRATHGLLVERGVEVVKQLVANVDRIASGLGNEGPSVEFLGKTAELIMVAPQTSEPTIGTWNRAPKSSICEMEISVRLDARCRQKWSE
ncbi:hypothetical protein KC366_g21 [Hortaea werneckii]|nr:hypothetical protein KC366_g21 [Hortaea werneckii]